MDSGGVNALLRTRALLGREERSLAVICPHGPVRRVLDVVGVAELFTIFATRDGRRRRRSCRRLIASSKLRRACPPRSASPIPKGASPPSG